MDEGEEEEGEGVEAGEQVQKGMLLCSNDTRTQCNRIPNIIAT
jgi:hypothetical protein